MSYNIQIYKDLMDQLGISPNKKLGQNFLINNDTCAKIVNKFLSFEPKVALEVGPGLGALTNLLLEAKVPLKLIELDKTMANYWKERNQDVVHGDALQIDWETLNLPPGSGIISNLPYQISSSLVVDRSIEPHNVSTMVLMFQKEVAERILAKNQSKEYGLLTVVAQSFWGIEKLLSAGSKDFYPSPQVSSQVLVFKIVPSDIQNRQKFLKFIKLAFQHRRKLLINNLSSYSNQFKEAFEKLNISLQVRAEDLTPQQFIELFRTIE